LSIPNQLVGKNRFDMAKAKRKTRTTPLSTVVKKKGKVGANDSIADSLLSTMVNVQVKRNNSSISFVSLMKRRKMNDRNTPWRNEWRSLIEMGFIRPAQCGPSASGSDGIGNGVFTATFELTQKGEDRAGTPQQKAMKRLIQTETKTTEERHAQIRNICMNNRTEQIFDLLLKYGSMSRKELAATIGISDRGAPFSYGLRQLKEFGYVVVDEKNSERGRKALMLSEKAFVNPLDRPKKVNLDPNVLEANMKKVYGKEKKKSVTGKSPLPVKKDESVGQEVSIKNEDATMEREGRKVVTKSTEIVTGKERKDECTAESKVSVKKEDQKYRKRR